MFEYSVIFRHAFDNVSEGVLGVEARHEMFLKVGLCIDRIEQ